MEVGELLQKTGDDTLWLVRKFDAGTKTAIVVTNSGQTEAAYPEDKQWTRVTNVTLDWPYITLPSRRGRLVQVRLGGTPLTPLKHWVKLDEYQMGGALFVSPELKLSFGGRLTLVRDDKRQFPVDVPRDFGSAKVRQANRLSKAMAKAKGPYTLYDHLMDDDL